MPSEKQYSSKYSNGKTVSAAQYITEIICENRAKQLGKDLHFRFWTNKSWSSFYRNQIASSHKLLEKYSASAIINALVNPKAKKIYSLRAPHLIPIIEEEESRVCALKTSATSSNIDRTEKHTFRRNKSNKNIVSKLKDIDNES